MSATGASEFAKGLMDIQAGDIFCITGAGNLALVDELVKAGHTIHYFHHEQAAAMAAIGYWRVCKKVPVVLVTTGGGSSNVATGLLSAYLDSIPILVITGNEGSYHIAAMNGLRAYGVQGFDSVGMFRGIAKRSERLSGDVGVGNVIRAAAKSATSGRPGPVHLDFPMDLQRSEDNSIQVQDDAKDESSIHSAMRENSAGAAKEIIGALETSLRPIILVGQGLTNPDSIVRFCEERGIPFSPSWSAIDKYDDENSLNIGRLGIYGERSTNFAVQAADLVICLGTRLSIPQVGYNRGDFGRNATKIVVDIDPLELSKHGSDNYILLNADANEVMVYLSDSTARTQNFQDWVGQIHLTQEILPKFEYETDDPELRPGYMHSLDFMERLNGILDDDAVVVTDVGAGLISGHYGFRSNGKKLLFTSQGLGEMGFGLPGAIGASIADRGRQVVCLSTDGGIMFNLQELQTVQTKKLPLKVVIFNNDGYGMIKISQNNLFDGRFAGSESGPDISFPNFSKLAHAFGFDYLEVEGPEGIDSLKTLMSSNSASIIEVKMDPNQKYLPRLGTRKLSDGSLQSPGLEDLDPPLPRETMARAKDVLGIE